MRRVHDGSRTRAEARVAIPSLEEPEEIPTPTRRFTVWETTSGLANDSREEDEWQEERRLRDLRGRVKRARAVVAGTPGLAEVLAGDWRRAALFCARLGVREEMFRRGVADDIAESGPTNATSRPPPLPEANQYAEANPLPLEAAKRPSRPLNRPPGKRIGWWVKGAV